MFLAFVDLLVEGVCVFMIHRHWQKRREHQSHAHRVLLSDGLLLSISSVCLSWQSLRRGDSAAPPRGTFGSVWRLIMGGRGLPACNGTTMHRAVPVTRCQ